MALAVWSAGFSVRDGDVVTTLVVAFRFFCGIFVVKDGVMSGKDA
jgi:hypothetical protein